MRHSPSRSHRRQKGQSLVELMIATPVLLLLLLGAFDVSVMISDKVIAGYACRQGARLGAELGGLGTNPGKTTLQIDHDIVDNVIAVALAMNYSTLLEVDVYQPANPNGVLNKGAGGDPYNQYDPLGNLVASGNGGFSIAARNQVPPNETSIGVRLVWTYRPPTGFDSFVIQLDEHAVMKASPVLP